MPDNQPDAQLNLLLIDLARSMLQYVGECWPWTGDDHYERQTIERLVRRQQDDIARLADFLLDRRQAIDFGTYPTDFTDLHYLALDHLLGALIENETALVKTVEQTAHQCADDPEARRVLNDILANEKRNLAELQALQSRHPSGSAA